MHSADQAGPTSHPPTHHHHALLYQNNSSAFQGHLPQHRLQRTSGPPQPHTTATTRTPRNMIVKQTSPSPPESCSRRKRRSHSKMQKTKNILSNFAPRHSAHNHNLQHLHIPQRSRTTHKPPKPLTGTDNPLPSMPEQKSLFYCANHMTLSRIQPKASSGSPENQCGSRAPTEYGLELCPKQSCPTTAPSPHHGKRNHLQ